MCGAERGARGGPAAVKGFQDHFSAGARDYSAHRPAYPARLFELLAAAGAPRRTAWDCATGSGQAALGLAPHFARVVATDASASQLAFAAPHQRVRYVLARAEAAPLATGSVDLVAVAQAAHWFDLAAFYAEVRRVVVRGGAVALWCYGLLHVDAAVDPILRAYYTATCGSYWPPERRLVDEEYRTLPFPFPRLDVPDLALEASMDLDALLAYVGTWSASQRLVAARGREAVDEFARTLRSAWGVAASVRGVRWPLHVLLGRVG
jgi:SAM-dependent methyltransferase